MITIGTHNGIFHADEVFAVATVKKVHPDVQILRSRDPEELKEADLLIDVGMVYDHAMGYYDHHQKGGAGGRWDTNGGVPYASFGLIWCHFGVDACAGNPIVADMVDEELVAVIDASDAGVRLCEGPNYSVSAIISGLNPTWCEKNRDADKAFEEAVDLAGQVLQRKIASCMARESARSIVRRAIAKAGDDPVIVLGDYCPWQEVVTEEAPSALYVVFQAIDGGWRVQSIPPELGDFSQRKPLPEGWAGLKANELANLTGVSDATFCHVGRFIAGAETKEGAERLAELAVLS